MAKELKSPEERPIGYKRTIQNLEIVDVCNFAMVWQKFYPMISKASMLKKLRLWGATFDDSNEDADLDSISISFPS